MGNLEITFGFFCFGIVGFAIGYWLRGGED